MEKQSEVRRSGPAHANGKGKGKGKSGGKANGKLKGLKCYVCGGIGPPHEVVPQ